MRHASVDRIAVATGFDCPVLCSHNGADSVPTKQSILEGE